MDSFSQHIPPAQVPLEDITKHVISPPRVSNSLVVASIYAITFPSYRLLPTVWVRVTSQAPLKPDQGNPPLLRPGMVQIPPTRRWSMIGRCGDRQRKFDSLEKWPFRLFTCHDTCGQSTPPSRASSSPSPFSASSYTSGSWSLDILV